MNKLTWEWFDDNSACFVDVEDTYYRRRWEIVISPTAADVYQAHLSRRGPYRIEVLTADMDGHVLSTRMGSRRYPSITKARAAAVRLMRRVRQAEHEARTRANRELTAGKS